MKKMVYLCLLVLVFPQLSNSQELCFPDTVESQKMLVEILYGKESITKLKVCQHQYSTSKAINNNDQVIITGLKQDVIIKTEISEEYKQKYIDTNNLLTKCEEGKPSRLTWYSYGVASALIGSLAVLFLAK